MNPLAGLAESHIKGNEPASSNFDTFLKRDLTAYFTTAVGKPVSVDYELLRNGPAQSGVSYPKYYLWVKIRNGTVVVNEGAVRVAAIEKQKFDVTHFLPVESMKRGKEQIYLVFPREVADKIKARLK